MKAGIYKRRDNGKHIYVSKDRSIRAQQISNECYPLVAGFRRVSCEEKEQVVRFTGIYSDPNNSAPFYADRVADVPNGTIGHALALQQYIDSLPNPQMLTYAEGARRAIADGTVEDGEPSLFGEEVKPGDIVIEFRDEGQDFLRWLCRDDLDGLTRVIDSEPYQDWVWNGTIVHNAENLVLGRAELANVTAVGWGTESKEITHVVSNAYRVEPSEGPGEESDPMVVEQIATAMQTPPNVPVHASDVQRTLDAYSQVYDMVCGDNTVGEFKTDVYTKEYQAIASDNAGERVQGRPRSLGIGFGAKSFLTSAKVIQEAGVGVPPHIARKIVEEYRASNPVDADFSKLEARVAAVTGDRMMQILRQDMHAAQWMQQNLAFGYLAEALGFAEVIQDSVYIHDLDKLEELKEHVKAGRYVLAKTTIGYELVDSLPGKSKHVPLSFEAATAIHLAAFPKFRFIDNGKLLALDPPARSYPVKGPPMHKSMKRHGAKGVVACTYWEKAVLQKLQAGEIRLCGKQSKRKHRKAGHYVFWFAPLQSWAWEKRV